MSAIYVLPGEVIELRNPLAALRAYEIGAGGMDPLPVEIEPGYYSLIAQRGERLFIAAVLEISETLPEADSAGQMEVVGPLFVVPASVLESEAVTVTYLKVRTVRQSDEIV